MYKIEVVELLDMPIDAAFKMLTDHSNYNLYPGIKAAQLLKSGNTEPNGVGAVREVKVSGATLQEEIIKFEPNKVMEYRITDSKPLRIYHPGGRMEFSEEGDKTRVAWTSEFGMQFPLFGQMLDNYIGPRMAKSFSNLLQGVASRYRFFNR